MTISDRHKRTPAGGVRGRRRKAGTGVLLLLALFAGLLGFAPSASAHHPEISGSVDCGNKVNWTATTWAPTANDGSGDNNNVIVEYQLNGVGAWTQVPTGSPGVFDAPGTPSFSGSFVAPGTPTSVTLRDRTPDAWGNGSGGGQITTGALMAFPTDCAKPDATAEVRCANNDILVTLTNSGTTATTATIKKNGTTVGTNVPVPVGSSTFSVGLTASDENHDVTIFVDFAVGTDKTIVKAIDCQTPAAPSADVQWACGSDATVVLTNGGQEAVTATILKNGVPVFTDVAVPTGDTVKVVDFTAADEDTSVTITVTFSDAGSGTDVTEVFQVNCDEPAPTIGVPVCARGGFQVTLGNVEGDDDAEFTIVINGVTSTQTVGAGETFVLTIPVDEGDSVSVSISSGDVSYVNESLTRNCEEPTGTVKFSCAAGGVAIDITNNGVLATDIHVNGGPAITVQPGATYHAVIPVAEGAAYSVTVTGDGLSESASGTRNCEHPSGTATFSCAAGGVVIDITNSGVLATDIHVNGGPAITVQPGATYHAVIPVAEGAAYSVTVTGDDGLNASASGTRNCEHPSGTVEFSCAAGGVVISITNDGDLPTDIHVNGGPAISVGAHDTYNATIPVAEGAAYSVTVTGDDGLNASASGTRNCEHPSGTVEFSCAAGGVVVSITNSGVLPTDIHVNGGPAISIGAGDTYNVTIPVAEGAAYSVTVTGDDGLNASASGTRNCEEPAIASVSLECAAGGVVVVLTNAGVLPATVMVNGTSVEIPAAVGGVDGSVSVTVPVAENASYDFDIVIDGVTTEVMGTRDCEHPAVVSATLECAEGGVVVLLTNSGEVDTAVLVDGVAVNVPAGTTADSPVAVTVPVAEDATYDFAVTGDELDESFSGLRNCEQPAIGSVMLECAEGGVVVSLTNDGVSDTTVTVDGVEVNVPAGTTADSPVKVTVPVDENADYDFTVVGDGIDQRFTGTANCLLPEPSVDQDVVCAKGGLTILLSNTGDDTATFVVTSSALSEGEATVAVEAGDEAAVLIPLAEGASADVTVTSDDAVLFDQSLTRDCETVEGNVVPPTSLPTTGSNTMSMLALAGALLLAGATLVAGGRRRLAEVLS